MTSLCNTTRYVTSWHTDCLVFFPEVHDYTLLKILYNSLFSSYVFTYKKIVNTFLFLFRQINTPIHILGKLSTWSLTIVINGDSSPRPTDPRPRLSSEIKLVRYSLSRPSKLDGETLRFHIPKRREGGDAYFWYTIQKF